MNKQTPVNKYFCILPWHSLSIDFRGKVTACCFNSSEMGDIRKTDITDIWTSRPYRELRKTFKDGKTPAGCRQCDRANIDWSKKYEAILRLRLSWRLMKDIIRRLL